MKLVLDAIRVEFDGKIILDGLNLDLSGSGITAVMGPSGAGKTTLLRLIAGLIRPASGSRSAGAKMASVFQDSRLLPWQSALDNAGFGLRASGVAKAAARREAAPLLSRLGLTPEDQRKWPNALSGGMRQRVAIARALAVRPDLLLLDEPFTGLDIALRADLQNLLRSIVDERQLASILVTHDPVEAVRLADRIIVLGGCPAKMLTDVPVKHRPTEEADVYAAAASVMRRPEVAAAFALAPVK